MEVIGSIYTGVTADFQRGLYPIARCVKAGNHDLGVVLMKQRRLGNLYGDDRGTGQTEKGCVYIQHCAAIWHGAGKQRTD